MARVFRGSGRRVVLLLHESRVAVDLRWTAHNVLGSIWPRWADKMLAQAFAAFWSYQWVVDQATSVFWAELV
jgi:hypothetical protein